MAIKTPLQNHQLVYINYLINFFYLVHPACRILAHYTSNQSLLSALPQLDIDLYIYSQGDTLLAKVKDAVCKDYRKLEVFAKVLCKITATAEIGRAIMRDYSKYLYYNIDQ